jgi:hypothetical protein
MKQQLFADFIFFAYLCGKIIFMRKQLLILSCVVGLCLSLSSCIKEGDFDFENLRFSYDLPIPLVDSRLTFGDLLKNIQGQYVIADDNGLLRLVYREEFSFDISDLGVFIPDQPFGQTIPSILVLPGDLFPADSIPEKLTFPARLITEQGIRIDSARTQAMNFRLDFFTEIRNRARIEITSPNIVDASGRPLTISELLPGVRSGTQQISRNLDLSNYYIIPNNSNPADPHALSFDYTITIFRDTLVTEAYPATTVLRVHFENIEIDYAYGYFGRQVFEQPLTGIDLPIFDRFPMDLLEVERANMSLTATNGLGLPVLLDAKISTLTRNPENPIKTLHLDNKHLDAPSNPHIPPVTTTFDEEIQDLINDNLGQLPYRLTYSATITTNPDDDQSIQNFVSKNSFIKMEIAAEVPMRLRVGGLVVSDTIPFAGFPIGGDFEIESLTIRVNLHNAFPLDAAVYLYLLDNRYQIIDSIWAIRRPEMEKRPLEIVGAPVDPVTGHVIRPEVAQLEIPLSKGQIENLMETQYFKIKGVLNTSDHETGMINIFQNSDTEGFLRVMIGCRVRFSGNFLNE